MREEGEKMKCSICETRLEKTEGIISSYYCFEDWVCKQKNKPIDIKSAMIWGALSLLSNLKCITWDEMRNIYGEFMSKQMNLR